MHYIVCGCVIFVACTVVQISFVYLVIEPTFGWKALHNSTQRIRVFGANRLVIVHIVKHPKNMSLCTWEETDDCIFCSFHFLFSRTQRVFIFGLYT